MTRIETSLSNISTKLDDKISNTTLQQFKLDSQRNDDRQDLEIEKLEAKIDKIIWSVAGVAFTSVGGLFIAIANRGMIT